MRKLGVWVTIFFSVSLFSDELLRKHSSNPLQAEAVMEALSPWETPIEGFFIRSHHGVPSVDRETWELVVDGLVEKPLRLSLKDLQDFKTESLHAVLECAGNWRAEHRPRVAGIQWDKGAVGNAEWTGIPLTEILDKARVKPEGKFVRVEGADKPSLPSTPAFVRSIPIAKMREKGTLLATQMNRVEMPVLHGGPLRLILPRWYGQNWIKWVTHLTVMEKEDESFYMKKGYRMPKTAVKPGEKWDSATGNPVQELQVQSLIVSPQADETVPTGKVTIRGKAFSGHGTIRSVDLSLDRGKTWKPTRLEEARPTGGWQAFEADIDVKSPAKLTVLSRATDSTGNTQPKDLAWNPSGYLGNSCDQVTFRAAKGIASHPGKDLVGERCLICHTRELVESQTLSAEAWDKLLTKMEGFGAKLTKEERPQMIAYLLKHTGKKTPTLTDYDTESGKFMEVTKAHGDTEDGLKLYGTHCASCHGDGGEGKTGPRLRGRAISKASFWMSVIQGKRTMPSFRDSLKESQVADLHAYLVKGR